MKSHFKFVIANYPLSLPTTTKTKFHKEEKALEFMQKLISQGKNGAMLQLA